MLSLPTQNPPLLLLTTASWFSFWESLLHFQSQNWNESHLLTHQVLGPWPGQSIPLDTMTGSGMRTESARWESDLRFLLQPFRGLYFRWGYQPKTVITCHKASLPINKPTVKKSEPRDKKERQVWCYCWSPELSCTKSQLNSFIPKSIWVQFPSPKLSHFHTEWHSNLPPGEVPGANSLPSLRLSVACTIR